MTFLDGRAKAGRDRQFESLAKEAAAAGSRVVDCVTVAPGGMSTGAAVGGAIKALFGGRFRVDTIAVLWLESNGWRHCYVQPYSGMTPMPGEHFGCLSGNLPAPATLRRGGMFKPWQWDSGNFHEVAQQLSQSAMLKAAANGLKWEWPSGLATIELDWALQLRSLGGGTSEVVMQAGRYGGFTTYHVGFAAWIQACRALSSCLYQAPSQPQAFLEPAAYAELVHQGTATVQVSAFVGSDPGQVSAEQAAAIARDAQATLAADHPQSKINAAANLLVSGQYQRSIDSYHSIAQAHPEHTGTCYAQIGAALFFLKHYAQAIEYYQAAKQYGADWRMMDDNIREAMQSSASR